MKKMHSRYEIKQIAKEVADEEIVNKSSTLSISSSQITTGTESDGKVMMADGNGKVKFGNVSTGNKFYLHTLNIINETTHSNFIKLEIISTSNVSISKSTLGYIDNLINTYSSGPGSVLAIIKRATETYTNKIYPIGITLGQPYLIIESNHMGGCNIKKYDKATLDENGNIVAGELTSTLLSADMSYTDQVTNILWL